MRPSGASSTEAQPSAVIEPIARSAARPLSLAASIPYFAIPSAGFAVAVWFVIGALPRAGIPLIWSFTGILGVAFAALGFSAVRGARADRSHYASTARRLWLSPLRAGDVVIGLVLGAAGAWVYEMLQATVPPALALLPFGPPPWADHFSTDGAFFDVPMAHHSWLWLVFLGIYLANVVGEEMWWRGYILPRQVAGIGRYAWLANALLWCGFHVFQPWDMLPIVPIALGIAYAAQRRQSAWIGMVAHGVLNSLAWIPLLQQVTL